MASIVHVDITKGTEFDLRYQLKDNAGVPFNLSGYTASGRIKRRFSDVTGLCDLILTPVAGYYQSGFLDAFIAVTGTQGLPVMTAVYDIRIFDTGSYSEQFVKGYAYIYPETMLP